MVLGKPTMEVGGSTKVMLQRAQIYRRFCRAARLSRWKQFAALARHAVALKFLFLEVVKQRNRMAKELGFEDFYDYKVTVDDDTHYKGLGFS